MHEDSVMNHSVVFVAVTHIPFDHSKREDTPGLNVQKLHDKVKLQYYKNDITESTLHIYLEDIKQRIAYISIVL